MIVIATGRLTLNPIDHLLDLFADAHPSGSAHYLADCLAPGSEL
jgi:hypothetical protein